MSLDVYQTTALVNPLSAILKEKYPMGLPKEIDNQLGKYFKNDNLIKFQDDYEITPFHNNGPNSNFTHEQYKQFRNASIQIFLENPTLFIKNRTKMAIGMFGVKNRINIHFDEFNNSGFPEKIKHLLGINKKYSRSNSIASALNFLFFQINKYPAIFESYIIPFCALFIILIFSRKAPWFRTIFIFIVARTFLIILITPANLFKYNYILHLFSLFCIPIVTSEIQTGSQFATKKSHKHLFHWWS
ncbi:MAG: hypothetical protein Q7U04_10585 [Bacteriovorax sp.]|nr:hypothetical protein [Bacteriovorax sp.]